MSLKNTFKLGRVQSEKSPLFLGVFFFSRKSFDNTCTKKFQLTRVLILYVE